MTPYFSKVISVSRFPIIVGVVFIHALIISNGTDLHYFLGNVVGRIGVPLFYIISGYLFFQRYDNSLKCYKNKLKKRIFSLLVPYLMWNFMAYLVYAFITHTMQPESFLQSFWVVEGKPGHSPADGPLWFVRTLMILSVISPIFYFLNKNKYTAYISPVLLLLWLIGCTGFNKGTVIGFTLFNTGAWLAIRNFDIHIKEPSRIYFMLSILLYLIVAFLDLEFKGIPWLHNVGILIGIFVFFTLPKIAVPNFFVHLGGASFFMYCMHEPVLVCLQSSGLYRNVGGYLIAIIITVFLCTATFYFLRKCFPKLCGVLAGNR